MFPGRFVPLHKLPCSCSGHSPYSFRTRTTPLQQSQPPYLSNYTCHHLTSKTIAAALPTPNHYYPQVTDHGVAFAFWAYSWDIHIQVSYTAGQTILPHLPSGTECQVWQDVTWNDGVVLCWCPQRAAYYVLVCNNISLSAWYCPLRIRYRGPNVQQPQLPLPSAPVGNNNLDWDWSVAPWLLALAQVVALQEPDGNSVPLWIGRGVGDVKFQNIMFEDQEQVFTTQPTNVPAWVFTLFQPEGLLTLDTIPPPEPPF